VIEHWPPGFCGDNAGAESGIGTFQAVETSGSADQDAGRALGRPIFEKARSLSKTNPRNAGLLSFLPIFVPL